MIQRAGPLHATLLATIHGRAFSAEDCWDAQLIAAQMSQRGVFALIDASGGMVIGRVAADEAEILTIAVAPQSRRVGLGSALVMRAAAEARLLGAATLFLEVSTQNYAARRLYETLGFTNAGRRRAYYADGTDALVLSRPLAGISPAAHH